MTAKKETHHTGATSCPICGRSIETGKGYICEGCGNELCKRCVKTIDKKTYCWECISPYYH